MNLRETDVRKVLDTRFIKAYELSYENGVRYIDASRHDQADLAALKSDQEIRRMLPDAVSCVLINETPKESCASTLRRNSVTRWGSIS